MRLHKHAAILAGVAAQPYASAAQSAPASYSAIPQQASADAAGANAAGASAGGASGAAGANHGNSGVLSGTTYQSSGATSPLTPYNTVCVAFQQQSFAATPVLPHTRHILWTKTSRAISAPFHRTLDALSSVQLQHQACSMKACNSLSECYFAHVMMCREPAIEHLC